MKTKSNFSTITNYAQPIDRLQLLQIQAAYAAGFKKAAAECGMLRPYISLKQAYRMYGQGTVERWADEGLIQKIKDGPGSSRVRIDREKIETVAQMSNRCSWYEHH
jgi:hypothetical protein